MDFQPTDLQVSDVSHRYGRRQSLVDVSVVFPVGVSGLLGPNGAGKSTLMKLVATALPLQHGSIQRGDLSWNRDGVNTVRGLVGYLPQRFEVMGWSTVRQNVAYAAWAHGLSGSAADEAVESALSIVDLTERAKDRARSLSGGMRQRLGLACALVHRPPILILDEPTVGLDPVQRHGLRQTIGEIGRSSVVLISTHLVEDLATVADQVIVMRQGTVCFTGSLDRLRALGEESADGHSSTLEAGYHAVQVDGRVPK